MEKRVRMVFEKADFRSCHACTVLPLDAATGASSTGAGGSFLLAWFGGHMEGSDGVIIWGCDCVEGEFSKPRIFASAGEEPHWNPVLFQPDPAAPDTWLFFKYGRVIATWRTFVCHSRDKGQTWSRPKELVGGREGEGGRGPVKNKMLVSTSGAWLAGSSDERGQWRAFVDRSTDQGASWQAVACPPSTPCKSVGVIQPSMWESTPGALHMLLRSDCGYVCRADSTDDGLTWAGFAPTTLPNNNSGLDVAKLADGRLVLAYNPTSGSWAGRSPLRLSLSSDNGLTWPLSVDIATGSGEFSYPAVVALPSGGVAVGFTWKRVQIALLVLAPEDLQEGAGLFVPSSTLPESKGTEATYSLEHFVQNIG